MSYSLQVPYSSAAAATIANVLTGTAVEYIGHATKMTIYGNGDATGDTWSLTGFTGSEPGTQWFPTSPVNAASTAGAIKTNEAFLAMIAVPANTRLVLTVVTSAAHTGRFLFVLE